MGNLIEMEQAIDASMGKRIVITDLPFQLNGHWGSCSEHLVIHGNGSITDTKGHDIGKCIEEPEIIRCNDCQYATRKYYTDGNYYCTRTSSYPWSADGFCSDGVRREDG